MKKITIKKKFLILIISLGILISSSALALEANWPNSPAGTPLNDSSDITVLVKYFYEWGITLGGLAVFIALVLAGFLYLTSIGDPTKIKEAKERITAAILGLVLLLGSWLILDTLNPEFTKLTIPSFGEEFEKQSEKARKEMEERAKEGEIDENITCDFAIFYSGENYSGAESDKPFYSNKKTERASKIKPGEKGSVRILKQLSDKEKAEIEREIKGEDTLEEKLKEIYGYLPYKKDGIFYIDGGNCGLTFYVEEARWFGFKTDRIELSPILNTSCPNIQAAYTKEKFDEVKWIKLSPIKF